MNSPTEITVVAKIVAARGFEAQVEQALIELIPPSRRDPGCLQYDLHRSTEAPHAFMFVERWESKSLLDEHLATPHLADYQRKVEGMIEAWELNLMERIA